MAQRGGSGALIFRFFLFLAGDDFRFGPLVAGLREDARHEGGKEVDEREGEEKEEEAEGEEAENKAPTIQVFSFHSGEESEGDLDAF